MTPHGLHGLCSIDMPMPVLRNNKSSNFPLLLVIFSALLALSSASSSCDGGISRDDLSPPLPNSYSSASQWAGLMSLHNSTAGARWSIRHGWGGLDAPDDYCGWYGVQCVGDKVVSVSLPRNNLQGTIPPLLFSTLPSLTRLDLSSNDLTGSIPSSLFSSPSSCATPSLDTLSLSHNSLSGTIPPLSCLRFLTTLHLAGNRLTGTIPPLTGSLHNLDLGRNSLTGTLRPSLLTLPALTHLSLSHNALAGTLPPAPLSPSPSIVGEAVRPINLAEIDISNNLFTGMVPSSWGRGNFSSLLRLHLEGNPLTGTIPSALLHSPLPSSGIHFGATGITGCAEARDALPPEERRLLACPSGTDISVDGVPFIAMGGDVRVTAPLEYSRAYTVMIPVGRNCPVSGACPSARVAWEASPRTALAGRDYDTDYGWGEPSYGDGGGNFPVDSGAEFGRGEVYWESASKANGTRGVLMWEEGEHGLKMITVNVLRLGGWRPSRFVSFGVGLVEGASHPRKRSIGVTIAGCVERYAAARPALAGSFGSSHGADQFDGQPGSCRGESDARCGDAVLTQVEECDDGNSISGDGCSSSCTVEAMYTCAGGTLTSADICRRDRALGESTQWLEPERDAVSRVTWNSSYAPSRPTYAPWGDSTNCVRDRLYYASSRLLPDHYARSSFLRPSNDDCAAYASSRGHKGFCVKEGGICYSARDIASEVAMSPASDKCASQSQGGEEAMSCFRLLDTCVVDGAEASDCHRMAKCVPSASEGYTCECRPNYTPRASGAVCLEDAQNLCRGPGSTWVDSACFKLLDFHYTKSEAAAACGALGAGWGLMSVWHKSVWNDAGAGLIPPGEEAWLSVVGRTGTFLVWGPRRSYAYPDGTEVSVMPKFFSCSPANISNCSSLEANFPDGPGCGYVLHEPDPCPSINALEPTLFGSTLYHKWKACEPNNYGCGEDCVSIDEDGYWSDIPCSARKLAVCSTSAPLVDECADGGGHNCLGGATCVDTQASFECYCDVGTSGHGASEDGGTMNAAQGSVNFSSSFDATPGQLYRLGDGYKASSDWISTPHMDVRPGPLPFGRGGVWEGAAVGDGWVGIDLGLQYPIESVVGYMWSDSVGNQSYASKRLEISASGDFENDGFTIIGCNSSLECGPETDGGYRIWAKGRLSASDGGTVMGRYVRWHVSLNFSFSSVHGGADGRGLIRFLELQVHVSTACGDCPSGTYADVSLSECLPCPAGARSSERGQIGVSSCYNTLRCDQGRGVVVNHTQSSSDRCFRYFPFEEQDWAGAWDAVDQARHACAQWGPGVGQEGGGLAVIDHLETALLAGYACRGSAWIALEKRGGASQWGWNSTSEDGMLEINGSWPTFWATSEPNVSSASQGGQVSFSGDACAYLGASAHEWYAADCHHASSPGGGRAGTAEGDSLHYDPDYGAYGGGPAVSGYLCERPLSDDLLEQQ